MYIIWLCVYVAWIEWTEWGYWTETMHLPKSSHQKGSDGWTTFNAAIQGKSKQVVLSIALLIWSMELRRWLNHKPCSTHIQPVTAICHGALCTNHLVISGTLRGNPSRNWAVPWLFSTLEGRLTPGARTSGEETLKVRQMNHFATRQSGGQL